MPASQPCSDTLTLMSALRAYAVKHRRAFGRASTARHLGVGRGALRQFTDRHRRPDVALSVLHRLGTDDIAKIKKLTKLLPGSRHNRPRGRKW